MGIVFIFKPDTLDTSNIGFIQGFVKNYEDNISFYITSDKLSKNSDDSVGYCSEVTPDNKFNESLEDAEWLHLNSNTLEIKICSQNDIDSNVVCINYDYAAFTQSDILAINTQIYGEHFETLANAIKELNIQVVKYNYFYDTFTAMILSILNVFLRVFRKGYKIFQYSAILMHFENSIATTAWLLRSIKIERKICLKASNVIISKLLDVLLGVLTIYYFLKYEEYIILYIQYSAEYIIKGLKQVLNTLMGSPAGLKLNFALNRTLGTFFFYHISLWRAFILAINPLLKIVFRFLIIPGLFGVSFQAAIFSDLIAFLTFHVYCIYVYAARLYGVQVRGLTSLWKLFIGRKYNPLRERVDSFQYTHNQLFIGTLGFTILLFLLPTTFLYYAVFTTFRLGLMILDNILSRIRFIFQCLPLLIIVLWCVKSSRMNGSLHIEVKETKSRLDLQVKLKTLPLWVSIKHSLPPTSAPTPLYVTWGTLFKGVFTGTLL